MGNANPELAGLTTVTLETKTDTIESSDSDISGFGFAQASLDNTNRALLTTATDAVRVTWDGSTTPSATVGHHIAVDKSIEILGNTNINNLKLIRVTNDAVVTLTLEE